jgi:hypothetical protein
MARPAFSFSPWRALIEGTAMSITENLKTTTAKAPAADRLADDLDRPIWGAKAIARAANLLDEDGEINIRKAFYKLEKGYIDADKNGDEWVTTLRRLRNLHHPIPDSGE